MNKYVVFSCLAATCTLGCTNLARRTETDSHFFISSPSAMTISLKPALAKLTGSPQIDSAKGGFAEPSEVRIDRPAASAPLTKREITSVVPHESKKAVAVVATRATASSSGLDGFDKRAGQALRAVLATEMMVSDSVVATLRAAFPLARHLESAQEAGRSRQTEQVLPPDIRDKIWYWLAWIAGALFTSILAPLIVDLIKLRTGFAQAQPDAKSGRSLRAARDPGERGAFGA